MKVIEVRFHGPIWVDGKQYSFVRPEMKGHEHMKVDKVGQEIHIRGRSPVAVVVQPPNYYFASVMKADLDAAHPDCAESAPETKKAGKLKS